VAAVFQKKVFLDNAFATTPNSIAPRFFQPGTISSIDQKPRQLATTQIRSVVSSIIVVEIFTFN
jgi:hypothetical protein